MGVNRNLDNEEGVIDDFRDERVCKAFLCGLCPHDLFSNTKQDLGACDYLHDEEFKKVRLVVVGVVAVVGVGAVCSPPEFTVEDASVKIPLRTGDSPRIRFFPGGSS